MLPNRIRVLWIEDEARYQLNELMGAVLYRREYGLNLAENASEAMQILTGEVQYNVIIVDMRIPPGEHDTWKAIYQKQGSDKTAARLGYYLVQWMLGKLNGEYGPLAPPPNWISPNIIAIFSAEEKAAIEQILTMGIEVYQPKDASYPDDILLRLISQVLNKKQPPLKELASS